MKSYNGQIIDDEVLMEFADGTLPEKEANRISEIIRNNTADRRTVSDFIASGRLIQLLRIHLKKNKINAVIS